VVADEDQMVQIFQNLIGNALKFRQEGIRPHVNISFTSAGNEHSPEEASTIEISVQDNGIGFEEKNGERIFAPFERLHGRGEYGGAGMGLAICRKIVERHGGAIRVKSSPGKGSTFTVSLPFDREALGFQDKIHPL
jgi:signal transduction histidine kinase